MSRSLFRNEFGWVWIASRDKSSALSCRPRVSSWHLIEMIVQRIVREANRVLGKKVHHRLRPCSQDLACRRDGNCESPSTWKREERLSRSSVEYFHDRPKFQEFETKGQPNCVGARRDWSRRAEPGDGVGERFVWERPKPVVLSEPCLRRNCRSEPGPIGPFGAWKHTKGLGRIRVVGSDSLFLANRSQFPPFHLSAKSAFSLLRTEQYNMDWESNAPATIRVQAIYCGD